MNDRIQDYNEMVSHSGKFEGEPSITPYLYDSMLHGDGELLATSNTGDSVTYFEITDKEFKNSTLKNIERGVLSNYFLLIENSDGFCTTMYFNTEADAREKGEFFYGAIIDDDDIIISDFNEIPAVIERMNKEQWYPNVWHINERGNTDLLLVNSDTGEYSILKSWV